MKKYLKILFSSLLVVLFLFTNRTFALVAPLPADSNYGNSNAMTNTDEDLNKWNDQFSQPNFSDQSKKQGIDYSNFERNNSKLFGINPQSQKMLSFLLGAGFGGIIMMFISIIIILSIIILVSKWKIYKKAGRSGWSGIIPIYNLVVLLEIIGKPLWWIILLFIPYVNIIFYVWSYNLFAKSFGKSQWFTAGLIFFPFIFFPILAFGDARYIGPSSKESMQNNQQIQPNI